VADITCNRTDSGLGTAAVADITCIIINCRTFLGGSGLSGEGPVTPDAPEESLLGEGGIAEAAMLLKGSSSGTWTVAAVLPDLLAEVGSLTELVSRTAVSAILRVWPAWQEVGKVVARVVVRHA
jgi:hypothetical protein